MRPNWQGSIELVTDTVGQTLLAANTYDEYGYPGVQNAGRFQYTGQAWVPEVGLYYYKARMYSPVLGRFMQTDPIGYTDQINLYEYVGDDPVDHEDYSGECAEDLCIVEGAIGYELISWGSAAAVGIYNWIHGPSLPAIHHAEQAPGSRPGKPFTQKGKDAVKDRNKKQNGGKQTCENPSCGKETVPGKKGEKGVTPPGNETNVDHVDPKSKGGSGTPECLSGN